MLLPITLPRVFLFLYSTSLLTASKETNNEKETNNGKEISDAKKSDNTKETGHGGSVFPLREYKDFQISNGTTGHSLEAAEDVFVKPFANVDLSTVSESDYQNLRNMSQTAIEAENEFNRALKKFEDDDDLCHKLRLGKLGNKLLKLTGALQTLKVEEAKKIKVANLAGRRAEIQKKLKINIAADRANHRHGNEMISFLSIKGFSEGSSNSKSGSKSSQGSSHSSGNDKTEEDSPKTSDKGTSEKSASSTSDKGTSEKSSSSTSEKGTSEKSSSSTSDKGTSEKSSSSTSDKGTSEKSSSSTSDNGKTETNSSETSGETSKDKNTSKTSGTGENESSSDNDDCS